MYRHDGRSKGDPLPWSSTRITNSIATDTQSGVRVRHMRTESVYDRLKKFCGLLGERSVCRGKSVSARPIQ